MDHTGRLKLQAQANLFALGQNPYPGRGFVVGLDGAGENLVQVYWIMGRSENSRNRIFGHEGTGCLFTEAADPSKVKDPSLIIYNAMGEIRSIGARYAVVSNGQQTDAVLDGLCKSIGPHRSLLTYQYEPDAPNFTPRITAVSYWAETASALYESGAEIVLLRKGHGGNKQSCDRFLFTYGALEPGLGYCLTTYSGDGSPLPSFYGEPLLMPLEGGMEQLANTYWYSLNEENRVSLAVKFIPREGPSKVHIINKYSKVA